jgi:hypothetical protein
MTGNVVTSEVDALMYVVLSRAGKHVPYGEFVGITECITLWPRCRMDSGRHNVHLCLRHSKQSPCIDETVEVGWENNGCIS